MSASQSELDLQPIEKPDPNVANFVEVLYHEREWITASKLLVKLRWDVSESKKRELRELAELSNGKIISGQRGYKHIRHASIEEIEHAANWLEHQAKEMGNRARAIRRQRHKLR